MNIEFNEQRRLGKYTKKNDNRNLLFARYLQNLLPPPSFVDRSSKLPASIGMMGNDTYGDCTVAAAAHMVQSWSLYGRKGMVTLDDRDILSAYFKVSPHDSGAYMLDVLNLWRNNGIGGEKMEGFAEVPAADLNQARLAIYYFGALYIGMSLPDVNTFGPWDVLTPTWRSNPYNGHAVALLGYNDAAKMFKVATWGEIWNMSYGWYQKYSDEAYAVLDDIAIYTDTDMTPKGFDFKSLQENLKQI
jgi:hypothetical protein